METATFEKNVITSLRDRFGRTATYLRVSLTDRCMLRCRYCMPEKGMAFLDPEELLTSDELLRLISLFSQLGVRRLRLTGGEPLLFAGLPDLISQVRTRTSIDDISITTNGQRLAGLAAPLKERGLRRVNISLDSFRTERFMAIARRGNLAGILEGIEAARRAGLTPIKINCVVMRGINDDELVDFCAFAAEKKVVVRFLEMMPTHFTQDGADLLVPVREMMERMLLAGLELRRLPQEPNDTAENYEIAGTGARIGFIGAVTRKFCASCNRIRIQPNGFLKLCLHGDEGLDLKGLLRSGASDDHMKEAIARAVLRKPWGSEFEESHYTASSTVMSQVGG